MFELILYYIYYISILIVTLFTSLYLWSYNKRLKPIIISIDGNIGSGKSTLLEILKYELKYNDNIIFLQEPVSEWINTNDGETNILNNFYKDKNRWAYTFQNFAFITRSTLLLEAIKNNKTNFFGKRKVIITERSTETDRNIFAKLLFDEGSISKLEYNIYEYWYNKLIGKNKINNVIYLRTTPKQAFERINVRNRDEEKKIPIDYIQTIHDYHDSWLINGTKNCNICYIDGNEDFQKNEKVKKKIVKSITIFINSLESRFYLPS